MPVDSVRQKFDSPKMPTTIDEELKTFLKLLLSEIENALKGDLYVEGNLIGDNNIDFRGDTFRLRTSKTPASSGANGNKGEICWDASYLYICTATDTWERVAIAIW